MFLKYFGIQPLDPVNHKSFSSSYSVVHHIEQPSSFMNTYSYTMAIFILLQIEIIPKKDGFFSVKGMKTILNMWMEQKDTIQI